MGKDEHQRVVCYERTKEIATFFLSKLCAIGQKLKVTSGETGNIPCRCCHQPPSVTITPLGVPVEPFVEK
jgi:hypothetical protein